MHYEFVYEIVVLAGFFPTEKTPLKNNIFYFVIISKD